MTLHTYIHTYIHTYRMWTLENRPSLGSYNNNKKKMEMEKEKDGLTSEEGGDGREDEYEMMAPRDGAASPEERYLRDHSDSHTNSVRRHIITHTATGHSGDAGSSGGGSSGGRSGSCSSSSGGGSSSSGGGSSSGRSGSGGGISGGRSGGSGSGGGGGGGSSGGGGGSGSSGSGQQTITSTTSTSLEPLRELPGLSQWSDSGVPLDEDDQDEEDEDEDEDDLEDKILGDDIFATSRHSKRLRVEHRQPSTSHQLS
jgi:hypothetical protein